MKAIKAGILMAALTLAGAIGCASKTDRSGADSASAVTETNGKSLVCYFSATGTTADAAERLAKISGGDLYEITPVARYTDADLDWRDTTSRSYVEMHDKTSRPAIATDSLPDMAQYDVVYVGYPNWWNTHPTIVNTFIEAVDLTGKTVVPFMTSGGSDIVNSEKELKESYPGLTFAKGMLMNHVSDEQIRAWVDGVQKK